MSVALSAIFIQYIYIYIYFRNCLDSEIPKQQSCFLLFYLRNCAVNEKEHHNSSTSKRSRRSSRWKEEVEEHKEPIAEDFENSCSLYICNTIIKSSSPTHRAQRDASLLLSIDKWNTWVTAIIIYHCGSLISANVSRKWANVSYCFSQRK